MYHSQLTNRKRRDTDPGFSVKIQGVSRAQWSVVLENMLQWTKQSESTMPEEVLTSIRTVMQGIESHVVDDADGCSLFPKEELLLSQIQQEALASCRTRHQEKLVEGEKLAKELETHLNAKKRRREKLTEDEKDFLVSRRAMQRTRKN